MVWVCCCKWCALVAALQRPSAHDFHRTPGDDLFGTILGGGFKDFCFTPGKPPTENSISVILPSFHIHHHLNHLVFLGYVTLTWPGPVLSHFGVVIQGRCSLAAAPSCVVRWQQRRCLQLTSVSFMAWYGEANLRKPQTWKQTMKLQSMNVLICWVPFGYFDWAENTYFRIVVVYGCNVGLWLVEPELFQALATYLLYLDTAIDSTLDLVNISSTFVVFDHDFTCHDLFKDL